MPKFSKKSKKHLISCDIRLQRLFTNVIKNYDCSILQGHRDEEKQTDFYMRGLSKKQWPESKHNKNPSKAIDVSPYPIPDKWGELNSKERAKFYHFAGFVLGVAVSMGIKIRWGGDWDSDFDFDDQTFDDLVHFEIVD